MPGDGIVINCALRDKAVSVWLEARAGSAHTRRAYETDLTSFFEFCGETVGQGTVAAWQRAMVADGLAARTVNRRVAAVSSFFEFCLEASLVTFNPVEGLERLALAPSCKSQGKGEVAEGFSLGELRALFWSIPRDTVVGLRDRALVFSYFHTGRRATEIRTLTWGEVTAKRFPLPAYGAIVEYLRAAGRLDTIEEGDLVFTALSDAATRLPTVNEMPEAGLSSSFVNRVIKKCARRAGLQWEANSARLRHAARALRGQSQI